MRCRIAINNEPRAPFTSAADVRRGTRRRIAPSMSRQLESKPCSAIAQNFEPVAVQRLIQPARLQRPEGERNSSPRATIS
jgi:hypothetical protein